LGMVIGSRQRGATGEAPSGGKLVAGMVVWLGVAWVLGGCLLRVLTDPPMAWRRPPAWAGVGLA
jgi:hypothetical protein